MMMKEDNKTIGGLTAKEWFERGNTFYGKCKYESAISAYSNTIELNSNSANAYLNRGLSKWDLGDHKSAIEDYDKAIELDPNLALTYYNRGTAKCHLKYYKAAIEDFDKVIELNPNLAGTYYNRGFAKSNLGYKEAAIKDYDKAIEIDVNCAAAYSNRGHSKWDLGDHESAIEDYDKAIELEPNCALSYHGRGNAKTNLSYYKSAKEDYSKAILLNLNYASAFSNRGNVKYVLGLLKEAQFDYNRFLFLASEVELFRNKGLSIFSKYTTPFLCWHTLQKFTDFKNLHEIHTIVEETRQQCRPLWYFLQFLALKGADKDSPFQYDHTHALINFYMGDPMTAYKIYNEKIDCSEYGLNLLGQYYFIESAKLFLEPHASILHFALEQIEEQTPELIDKQALRELYYAGLILYHNDRVAEALDYFEKADAYLPAAFMQILTLKTLGKDANRIAQKIKDVQKRDITEGDYLAGFPKQYLELESGDYFDTFKHYAHYQEILEVIGDIRDPNAAYEHNELWDAFRWRKADLDELAWLVRKEELGVVSRALFEKLRANIKDNYDSQKHKELVLLEEKLGKGYLREPNMMLFHKLKQEADTGANMESLLGELITAQVFDANTNALLVEYFYLKGNVAAYGVYALYFYINYASQKNNPLKDTADSMLPEMGKKIVELSINATSFGAQVLTAGASQSMIDLIKRTLQADDEDLISKEEKTSSYDKFIENFLKFINYERETMNELEFNQRYPLEGFDDWRKKK